MSLRIIKQPDGKWGIFSPNVKHFLFLGANRESVIEFFVKEEATKARKRVIEKIDNLEEEERSGNIPHWRMNFKDALEIIEKEHGQEERDNIWKFVGKLKRIEKK